ncbi:hypothetical protein QQS21_004658 [Conoideocrella luteorostrata]|uniref:Zn(2)-C6 fungal-type domain-containing protein n=1 Tax=Conoideocrella luteorostrata TaxID=1105319 RepID=A0AAJ0CRX1_9HYPO|nr:hypothetical protein QQS21_004658 [Conoideocrella luteorostrata]
MPKRRYGGAAQQISTQKRQRAYAACTECRRRKRKCDGTEPCSSCHGYGYRCSYHAGADSESDAHNSNAIEGKSPTIASNSSVHPGYSSVSLSASTQENSPTEVLVSKPKGRYINAHSAVALPHLVGLALGASVPPRLHSFAWNLGSRPERKWAIHDALSSFITLQDCRSLSSVYFATVHPMFPFLPQTRFLDRLSENWSALESQPNFAAVVAGVAALGSFFAEPSYSKERELVDYSFSILDLTLSTPISLIDLDSVGGWLLRTLYIRLTTRPALACLASQTAIHVAEILSLHREISERDTASSYLGQALFSPEELDTRRRHYWVAWCLNCLVSAEFGLDPVKLSLATCSRPKLNSTTHMQHLVSLSEALSSVQAHVEQGLESQAMTDHFARLRDIPSDSVTFSIFKAEVCIGTLRRYVSASRRPGRATITVCVAILDTALESVDKLLSERQHWWNLLSVPFQSVCLILHFDDDLLLALLPKAMDALRRISNMLDTHLTKEALNTAQQLVALSRDGSENRAQVKTAALGDSHYSSVIDWSSLNQGFAFENWPLGLDFMYEN